MHVAPSAPPVGQPRRSRLRAEDVRHRMLEAGRDWAGRAGVGVSLEEISMEDVIQQAGVPRSSVYRMWNYKSEFAADLLVYLAGPGGYLSGRSVFDPDTFDVARKTMAEHAHLLATDDGRRRVLCAVVCLAVNRNFERMLDDHNWRVHLAMLATLTSIRDCAARMTVAAALEAGEAQARAGIVSLIQEIMATVGLRLRDPASSVEHLVIAGVSLLQNLAVRHALTVASIAPGPAGCTGPSKASGDFIAEALPGPAGVGDSPVRWSLPALAYLSLVDAFAELDPDFRYDHGPVPANDR